MTRILGALTRSCAFMLMVTSIASIAQPQDVPPEQQTTFAEAMKLRATAGKQEGAYLLFTQVHAAAPGSFTVNYEYGRLLAQMKKYREASEVLDTAIKLMDRLDTGELTVYNTKGFVLLMLNQYDQAIDFFRKEINSPKFSKLPSEARMRVHNNAGLAHLNLNQYIEAQQHFEIARSLGSSLAKKNLEIIGSILETLRASSE